MALDRETLESMIKQAFPEAKYELVDLAGDDNHWSLTIESSQFKGLNRVKQHKLVYGSLQGTMGNELHALQLKTIVV